MNFDTNFTRASDGSINRYYDPTTAQFLSVDPAVGLTGSPYANTGGDPINGVDSARAVGTESVGRRRASLSRHPRPTLARDFADRGGGCCSWRGGHKSRSDCGIVGCPWNNIRQPRGSQWVAERLASEANERGTSAEEVAAEVLVSHVPTASRAKRFEFIVLFDGPAEVSVAEAERRLEDGEYEGFGLQSSSTPVR